MSKPIVKISRHSVPERAKMFRVPAAQVLWCAYILWWSEFGKEIIVCRPKERAFTIHCRFTDHARLMDIEILERIIQHAIGELVTVVVALGAARTALSNPIGENLTAARNLGGSRGIRKLCKR